MEQINEVLEKLRDDQIGPLLQAVLERHRQIYPDWETMVICIDRRKDRNEQLREMIAVLRKLAEDPQV